MAFGLAVKAPSIRIFLRLSRCNFSVLPSCKTIENAKKDALRACLAKVESGSTSIFDAEGAAKLLRDTSERRHVKKYTIVLVALGHCSSWPKALDLFEAMFARALSPDAVTYGAIVAACARNAQWAHALWLASSSINSPVDRSSLTSVLRCTETTPNLKQNHIASLNAAISACAKKGRWQWASLVLFEMFSRAELVPDIISFNASITACDRAAQWQRALLILRLAQRSSLELQTHTFNATLGAIARVGRWEMAFTILQQMHCHGLQPNAISLNAVIGACGEASNWETALRILDHSVVAAGVVADERNFNCSMNACARSSQWRWALQLLQVMIRSEMVSDATSFATAISACEKSGRSGQALQLLSKMHSFRIAPDVVTFSSAISACEKASFWESALSVLYSIGIGSGTIGVDIVLFNAAVSACDKGTAWRYALELLAQIPAATVEANIITLGASVAACSKYGRWRKILHILSEAKQVDIAFDAVILTCAARAFEESSAFRYSSFTVMVAAGCSLRHLARLPRFNLRAHTDCTGVIELMHGQNVLTTTALERIRHYLSAPALRSLLQLLMRHVSRDSSVRDRFLQGVCDLGGVCTRDALQRLYFDDGTRTPIGILAWLMSARFDVCKHILIQSSDAIDGLSYEPALPKEPVAARLVAWVSHDLQDTSRRWHTACLAGEITQGGTRHHSLLGRGELH